LINGKKYWSIGAFLARNLVFCTLSRPYFRKKKIVFCKKSMKKLLYTKSLLLCCMNRFSFFLALLLSILLLSCADKYKAYKSQYSFKSPNGKPDYSQLDYWAAHPWKKDPSDSVPRPLQNDWRDSSVDVFFLHPTTYTSKKNMKEQNADINDEYINAKTDYSSILYQASAFNQQGRVFAPRYRQAHINTFFMTDKQKADSAFSIAYQDLKAAFEYYLQHWNNGRPIIIASHSQGSMLAERLMKEFFDEKPLQNKLVVAYIIGWAVPKNYFTALKVCSDSSQTGCICSWRTFRKDYIPSWMNEENRNSYVTNPLSWTTSGDFVSRKKNNGSVLKNFNKLYTHTTDAQISNGILYTRKPKFPFSFLYFTKNYHVGDINLYYLNLRQNVSHRISMFWKR
jgi:Protein of unknown function (DUF3089)